jgi:DNA-binding beta-propeller fold protein YncE
MLADKLRSATAAPVPEGAWDLAYAYYNPPSGKWDISTADFVRSVSVGAQETSPNGISFKPDGTKMYIVGSSGDDVNEYTLSTAWDISTASYLQNFSVAGQETSPNGISFKPDGTKMYIVGSTGDDVNEYTLSTAWDISTASYLQNFSVAGQETSPNGISFKPDGTKMYIVGSSGDDVNEYTLSTAWNVSTASYLQNFSVAGQETIPQDIFFKPDGTKMYVCGSSGDDVNEYTLSTAWDISTASYLQNFLTSGFELLTGIFFRPDGAAMYLIGSSSVPTYSVQQYVLGGFSISAQETIPQGIFFKPDGTKMYVCGSSGDDVNEYTLSTAWDISTASYLQNFSVAGQETSPSGIFFKPDGTKMYVCGSSGDDVNEYNLSTAWDISTASFLQLFSVSAQELTPSGVFFKPDGTKMYIVGQSGDDVNEYNLSTAWDISTASYLQNFSVVGQDTSPSGIFFKPDGTKMYIVGFTGQGVNEYNLSTAWDVSTASFVQAFSVGSQGISVTDVFFKPDGTAMYTVDSQEDQVFQYSLGVQE